jgi:hypothetical protein
MTQYVIANNVNTTLAVAAGSTATTLTLASSANLPTLSAGQVMPLTLNDAATGLNYEIVYVTAISGTSLTVQRSQENTGALNWSAGDYAYCAITAGTAATAYGNANNPFLVGTPAVPQDAAQFEQIGNYQGIVTVSSNTTIPSTGFGYLYQPPTGNAGGFTITLPTATGNAGKCLAFFNSSSGNIALAAGNFNTSYGAGTSIVLPPNSTAALSCDGVSYNGVGGSAGAGSGTRPQSSPGVGQWASLLISPGTSGFIALPAGGSWAYTYFNQTTVQSGTGVAAGGTTLLTGAGAGGVGIANAFGFCWRIA